MCRLNAHESQAMCLVHSLRMDSRRTFIPVQYYATIAERSKTAYAIVLKRVATRQNSCSLYTFVKAHTLMGWPSSEFRWQNIWPETLESHTNYF